MNPLGKLWSYTWVHFERTLDGVAQAHGGHILIKLRKNSSGSFKELPNELIDGFIGAKFKMYPLISKRSKGRARLKELRIYPVGNVRVNCPKTLNKPSMGPPGMTPSAPSDSAVRPRPAGTSVTLKTPPSPSTIDRDGSRRSRSSPVRLPTHLPFLVYVPHVSHGPVPLSDPRRSPLVPFPAFHFFSCAHFPIGKCRFPRSKPGSLTPASLFLHPGPEAGDPFLSPDFFRSLLVPSSSLTDDSRASFPGCGGFPLACVSLYGVPTPM